MADSTRTWRPWLLGVGIPLVVLAILVAVFFLVVDAIARARFESKLERVHGHTASVGSADVDLFSRHITFEDIVLERENSASDQPWLTIERLEVQVLGPMLRKSSRTKLRFIEPVVHMVRGKQPASSQLLPSKQAREDIEEISRWDTDVILIEDGTISYEDRPLAMGLDLLEVEGEIRNYAAASDPTERERFEFEASGQLEQANVEIEGSSQLGVETPSFDLKGAVVGFPLMEISNLVEQRMQVRVADGYAAVGVDMSGEDGRLSGYFAPQFSKLELEGQQDSEFVGWLESFVGEIAADAIADPIGDASKRLEFVGSYGGGGGLRIEARDEGNSWLQEKVLHELGS